MAWLAAGFPGDPYGSSHIVTNEAEGGDFLFSNLVVSQL